MQGINSPVPMEEQVVSIYAGTRGHLDKIAVPDVGAFETALLDHFRSRHNGLLSSIRETGNVDLDDLENIVSEFASNFQGSAASAGITVDPEAQPDASSNIVDSDITIPERDITRPEED